MIALVRWTVETAGMFLVAGVCAVFLVAVAAFGLWCLGWVLDKIGSRT